MAQLQSVLSALQQTQGPDPQGIKHAEAQLKALSQLPGFGVVLLQIALASKQEVPAPTRQLAAVLLKQYVKQHWISGERGFEPPGTLGCAVHDQHTPALRPATDRPQSTHLQVALLVNCSCRSPSFVIALFFLTHSQRQARRIRHTSGMPCQLGCVIQTPRSGRQSPWQSLQWPTGTGLMTGRACSRTLSAPSSSAVIHSLVSAHLAARHAVLSLPAPCLCSCA